MVLENERTGRRHVQAPMSRAGYWFKQRGYTEPSFDRQAATTTGEMLNQISESKLISATLPTNLSFTTPLNTNRRHPTISNRTSEHDNRNIIQNYGEYFGRGFGKRSVTHSSVPDRNWIFSNQPRPVHPDRSITQHDYRGWPPLDKPQLLSTSVSNKSRKITDDHWMKSCYDDYGRNIESVPSELIYRDDYKRMPVYPWHY